MSEKDDLLKSAEDALARGFAIFPCLPHKKEPFSKYAPNGFKNASRNPVIALKAWHDGEPANYGIACGETGLTVVDLDTGINNYEEFIAWRDAHNIPPTLTVRTGRRFNKVTGAPEYGVQMYFSGAVPTHPLNIDGVVGDLKGIGGYVCGAGSIHPDSGEKYEIIIDVDVVPLPDGLKSIAKPKLDFKPKAEGGDLIPAGNRWVHCQSVAGKLRNAGLDRDGIYTALRNFLKNNCEDGENYPDDKIQNLADAAFNKFDATESAPIINVGGADKKINNSIDSLDKSVIAGDWIGDMTKLLTDGTHIPPDFVHSTIKTILGASIDGMVGYPQHTDLHTRNYNFLIAPADSGKGASWQRVTKIGLAHYMLKTGLAVGNSGWFSSGEYLVKKFVENAYEDKRSITHFDEMRLLFEKGAGQNSTLNTRMLTLYDSGEISAGSCTNAGGTINHTSVSITGGFTRGSFDKAMSGIGVSDDGLLSRCCLSFCNMAHKVDDWVYPDAEVLNALQTKMLNRWQQIQSTHTAENIFVPTETEAATAVRKEFNTWLRAETEKDAEFGQHFGGRLDSHFKRDVLLRTVFSEDANHITEETVVRSAEWARHELGLRRELWPADSSNPIARMCVQVSKAFTKREHLTKAVVMNFCNVKRDGSYDEFNRAWKAMLMSGELIVVGKSKKKTDIFSLIKKDGDI